METAQPDSQTCRIRNTLLGAIRTHLAAIEQFHWVTALAQDPGLISSLITMRQFKRSDDRNQWPCNTQLVCLPSIRRPRLLRSRLPCYRTPGDMRATGAD